MFVSFLPSPRVFTGSPRMPLCPRFSIPARLFRISHHLPRDPFALVFFYLPESAMFFFGHISNEKKDPFGFLRFLEGQFFYPRAISLF